MKTDDEKTLKEFAPLLDRAIDLCARFVPVADRAPTPGGGSTHAVAVGVLVAARAFVEAMIESEKARP